jgi:hypothetical protein
LLQTYQYDEPVDSVAAVLKLSSALAIGISNVSREIVEIIENRFFNLGPILFNFTPMINTTPVYSVTFEPFSLLEINNYG